jgi:hypothetical protein
MAFLATAMVAGALASAWWIHAFFASALAALFLVSFAVVRRQGRRRTKMLTTDDRRTLGYLAMATSMLMAQVGRAQPPGHEPPGTTPSDVRAPVRAPTVSLAPHAAYSGGGWAMIHTVVSKEINAPPERVAALYVAYEGWPQLFPATIRGVRLLADGGQRKTIEVDHATEGKVINIMIAVSPREIQLEEFKQRFDARFTNRFEAAGQGTRYSIVADVQLKGAARVLGPLVTPIVRARLNRFVLEPMRAALEGYGEGSGSKP